MSDMQATFDAVATHLLKQGRQAKGVGFCAYRGLEGTKCAVGCLIPDELYHEDMEGKSAHALLNEYPALHKVPLINGFEMLLTHLQVVHDLYKPEWWKKELRRVAEEHNLNPEILESLP